MQDAVPELLRHWESFYVIVGTSGAALTGLQFVVVALVAESRTRSSTPEIEAFATPTIVHFCAVLMISAVLSAPWHALSSAALVLGVGGAAGVGYTANVIRRARRQNSYRLVVEDWVWHVVLPLLAYGTLFSAALALGRHTAGALFLIGATVLLLLFVGIHNAWDTVTYIAVERAGAGEDTDRR
jgi:hypothetical protein